MRRQIPDGSERWSRVKDPAKALAALEKAHGQGRGSQVLPDHLPVSEIRTCEAVFQPRELDARHVSDLQAAIRDFSTLDPITIIQIGRAPCVIDGHHRLAAYRAEGVRDPVPVTYHAGSVREAFLLAGLENSKHKLPMSNDQRLERAWLTVKLGGFSKRETSRSAGVSERTVARMRVVKDHHGARVDDFRSWAAANMAFLHATKPAPEWDEDALSELVATYAKRMHDEFGSTLTGNIDLAARVLEEHFGKRAPELGEMLIEGLDRDQGDDDDDIDDDEPEDTRAPRELAPPAQDAADAKPGTKRDF